MTGHGLKPFDQALEDVVRDLQRVQESEHGEIEIGAAGSPLDPFDFTRPTIRTRFESDETVAFERREFSEEGNRMSTTAVSEQVDTKRAPGASAPTTIADGEFRMIPLEQLRPSPTNPRKTFTKAEIDELAESVRSKGVLVPPLVRPLPSHERNVGPASQRFEIVAGERRFRAAKQAGLKAIPCRVRDLDDAETLEVQVIENLQRRDLHELEEAEGYEQLLKTGKYENVDALAAKVGKSRGYVYGRLKLTALGPEARKAFREGKLSASIALLVARIPDKDLQLQAVKDVTNPRHGEGPLTFVEASRHIHQTFMLRLAGAPFSTTDEGLVPTAGSCVKCPKRTGNQAVLFDDVKSADVCTDPPCFQRKADAAWSLKQTEITAAGGKVLDDAQARKAFTDGHNGRAFLSHNAGYVDLKDEAPETGYSKTYAQALGKHARPEVVVARASDNTIRELIPKGKLAELLKAAGVKRPSYESGDGVSKAAAARAKREREKTMLENKVRAAALAEIRKRVAAPLRVDDLRLIAETYWREMHHESRKQLLNVLDAAFVRRTRSGASATFSEALDGPFKRLLAGLKDAQAVAAVLVVMSVSPRDYYHGGDLFPAVAKRYKVDVAKLRRELAPKPKPKAAAKAEAPAATKKPARKAARTGSAQKARNVKRRPAKAAARKRRAK